jgi:hypothetical protein
MDVSLKDNKYFIIVSIIPLMNSTNSLISPNSFFVISTKILEDERVHGKVWQNVIYFKGIWKTKE